MSHETIQHSADARSAEEQTLPRQELNSAAIIAEYAMRFPRQDREQFMHVAGKMDVYRGAITNESLSEFDQIAASRVETLLEVEDRGYGEFVRAAEHRINPPPRFAEVNGQSKLFGQKYRAEVAVQTTGIDALDDINRDKGEESLTLGYRQVDEAIVAAEVDREKQAARSEGQQRHVAVKLSIERNKDEAASEGRQVLEVAVKDQFDSGLLDILGRLDDLPTGRAGRIMGKIATLTSVDGGRGLSQPTLTKEQQAKGIIRDLEAYITQQSRHDARKATFEAVDLFVSRLQLDDEVVLSHDILGGNSAYSNILKSHIDAVSQRVGTETFAKHVEAEAYKHLQNQGFIKEPGGDNASSGSQVEQNNSDAPLIEYIEGEIQKLTADGKMTEKQAKRALLMRWHSDRNEGDRSHDRHIAYLAARG